MPQWQGHPGRRSGRAGVHELARVGSMRATDVLPLPLKVLVLARGRATVKSDTPAFIW
jgi:hypothetical protein